MTQDGDRFWSISECYIRGNTIKYLRVPEKVGVVACMSARSNHDIAPQVLDEVPDDENLEEGELIFTIMYHRPVPHCYISRRRWWRFR